MPRAAKSVLVAFVLLAGLAPAAGAQSIWLDRVSPRNLHLEVAKPIYDDDGEDFLTTNWWLSGRFPLGAKVHLVGEVPYARYAEDGGSFESSSIGNLYVGVETNPVSGGSGAWFEGGLRLPTVDSNELASIPATFVDTDRWEAFTLGAEAWNLHTAAHWRSDIVGHVGVDVRAAPNVWFGGDLEDVDLLLVYGAQVLYHGTGARAGIGLTGRWLATFETDDDTSHQVEAAADFFSGSVRPGFTARLPLDEDLGDIQQAVIGVSLTVALQ